MTDSDYFYESGEPIEVGSHGDTDYFFSSGEPVLNNGRSKYFKETGVGVGGGGGLTWNPFTDGHPSANVSFNTGQEEVLYEFTDQNTGGYWIGAYSNEKLDTPPWEVTFQNVNGSQNDIENNVGLGVVTGTPPNPRPFLDAPDHHYIGYHYDEQYIGGDDEESATGHALVTNDPNSTAGGVSGAEDNVVEISAVDFSDTDFTVGFDGTDAYLVQDGTEIARTSTQAVDASYMVVCSIEDDGDSPVDETVSVGAVTFTQG